MALHAVELRGEVADVGALDFFGRDLRGLETADHALAHQRREMLVFLGPVAAEVGLVAAQDVDIGSSCHLFILLKVRDAPAGRAWGRLRWA